MESGLTSGMVASGGLPAESPKITTYIAKNNGPTVLARQHYSVPALKFSIDTYNDTIWERRYLFETIVFGIYSSNFGGAGQNKSPILKPPTTFSFARHLLISSEILINFGHFLGLITALH